MQETQEMWVRSLGQEEPWSRTWQPTPIFFTGKFHGQRSLAGRSPYGSKELDLTEHTERRGICSLSFDWNRFFFFFYIYCALYFTYCYISFTLDHQALAPRGTGGPCCLSIPYIIAYICWPQPPTPFLAVPSFWIQTQSAFSGIRIVGLNLYTDKLYSIQW